MSYGLIRRATQSKTILVSSLMNTGLFQLWQPRNVVLCMLLVVSFGAMVVGSMFLKSTVIWLVGDAASGRMVMGANSRLIEVGFG